MKKIKYVFFVIAIGILFSSCKSNLAISKRHYTNGYHIVRSEAKCGPIVHQIEKSETKIESTKLASTIDRNSNRNSSNSEIVLSRVNSASSINTTGVVKRTTLINRVTRVAKQKMVAPRIFSKIKQQIQQKNKINESPSDDELSLFWIIILVLLILWALGFISGGFALGSIINLLLLAALILFILWLLHVV